MLRCGAARQHAAAELRAAAARNRRLARTDRRSLGAEHERCARFRRGARHPQRERVFRERIPGARGQPHIEIANAGHFIQEEGSEALSSALLDLLARQYGQG
jgi:pimeloyl-ACP methyl ester carboxylesterase